MIRRVTPNRHASLDSRSSCCGFIRKKELKSECQFDLKPKDLKRNLTLSSPYRDLTIVEDELDRGPVSTPRPTNPTPRKLFSNKEESLMRPSSGPNGLKAASSVYTAASPSALLMTDDFVGRPLEKLKDKRKNSHISNPLSISYNSPSISFTYSGKATGNTKWTNIILDRKDIAMNRQAEIEKEVGRLQEELWGLLAETERLKHEKDTNIQQYKSILTKLSRKEEEIKLLEKLRREEIYVLRLQIESLISSQIEEK